MKKTDYSVSDVLAKRAAQVQRGSARAAVLGVNDGLVSILCIVIGVAATGADAKSVLIAGFAGTLAGAISMAAGEWISVKAQVDLFEGVLKDLKEAIKKERQLLTVNLAKNFEEHGVRTKDAENAAKDIAADDKQFISMYSSQVIGFNEDELGSPWWAAGSSFVLFVVGSLAPLFPWLIGWHGKEGIALAIALTGFLGLLVGGYTARSSGKSIVHGAVRQLLIIVFAAGVTYGIGHVFGVAIG